MSNKRNSRKFGEAKPAEDAAVADYETSDDSAADVATAGDDSAAGEAPEAGEEPETIVASVEASQDAAQEQAEAAAEEDLDGEDSLTFSNGVIEKIVAIAMHDVPGVIGMKGGWLNRVQDVIGVSDSRKGVSVEVTPDASVRVNISVLIEYGAYAPQVFEDVKKAVVKNVTGMTGLSVAGVNLRIEDVLTADEVAARNKAEKVAEDKALAEAAEAATAAGDEAAE
ncbi:Asp23/Gls24 family envelope stress response protein [Parafannyhessea umbonata]|uniref:Asp23/Gls24 family envelope stress response protein n=1 Tax=Parafannyhessea umbonata TaxID=604330 RepID=UPI001F48F965|nr:Asp23/Gls24 family envelope stress response protein [Parafannyhessea umbonata]